MLGERRERIELELAELRRRVERLERENRALRRWSAALERAGEIQEVEVWLLDEDLKVVACNSVAARGVGRSREAVRGRLYAELLSTSGDRGRVQLDFSVERRGPFTVRAWVEPRQVRGQGRRYVQVQSIAAELDGESTTLLVHTDATARRRVEEELAVHRRRLELALESASIGLWDWDMKRGEIKIDLTACEIVGAEPRMRRAPVEFWRDVVHPDDRERAASVTKRHLEDSSEPYAVEHRVRRLDTGEWRWLSVRGSVQSHDRHGCPLRMLGIVQDITTRKLAATRLEESERKFRMLAENIHGVVYLCRHDARYSMIYVNDAVERLTGYSREDFLADRVCFVELFHPSDRDDIITAVDAAVAARRPYNLTYRLRHRSGEWRWVDEAGVGVFTARGELLHLEGYVADVTARKRIEAEREQLLREFERKNTELERFSYTVSHDLKSPLISIQSFAGLVSRDLEERRYDRVQEDIGRIQRAAASMSGLLNDLLELSRIGRRIGARTRCSLAALAHEVLERLRGTYVDRDIEFSIAEDMPAVWGDPERLQQLLQNLISNAIKYTVGVARARVELGWRAREDGVTVYQVRDNGVGIAPEHFERVFGVFEQLDPEREGTGVGLAIAQRIVEVHGGRLWLESRGEGTGCTACFTIGESAEVTS